MARSNESGKRMYSNLASCYSHTYTHAHMHTHYDDHSTADNISHFIVQCDLFSVDQKSIRNVVYHPASINPAYPNNTAMVMSFQEPTPMRNLMGTVVSSAHQLIGLDNHLGIYFVFGDLSVRTEGRFVLRFRFIDLSAG